MRYLPCCDALLIGELAGRKRPVFGWRGCGLRFGTALGLGLGVAIRPTFLETCSAYFRTVERPLSPVVTVLEITMDYGLCYAVFYVLYRIQAR